MNFEPPLQSALFLRRYKRFFADILLPDGNELTIHCPNTGSMLNCLVPNTPCWFSLSDNPKRKLPGTLELVTTTTGGLACVNTHRANAVVEAALRVDRVPQLTGYATLKREVRYGKEGSRIDFLLADKAHGLCYIEVKSVTLGLGQGLGVFPDAVTARGLKHLRELVAVAAAGHRAVLFFCVLHEDVHRMAPAAYIDPAYAQGLTAALAAGVEVMVWRADLSAERLSLAEPLPFEAELNLPGQIELEGAGTWAT